MTSFLNKINSKLSNVETSIFAVMSKMCAEHNALNLSQGYPDFESDPQLIQLVNEAMRNGKNQYAPMPGVFGLRTQISEKVSSLYGTYYNPENEITVTAGATQAIFTVLAATIHKDDEVIIFKPAYDCYEPTIKLFGGKPMAIQLDPESFKVDWDVVKSMITAKTRMIIINTPHNPSGTVLSKSDMLELEKLLSNTNILLLSDEVYEHIIFDDEKHQSAALFPRLAERAFITASFGKTFHNTGWKMGYCLAPKALMEEFQKVHQFNVFSVNHPMQVALEEYLKTPNNYLKLGSFYQQKRDVFLNLMKNSRFKFEPSKGTYFQLMSYKNISNENDIDFTKRITKELGVGSIPISVFNESGFDTKVVRFCFAKKDDTLIKAAEILCSI
jgi:methionine aminotransferase